MKLLPIVLGALLAWPAAGAEMQPPPSKSRTPPAKQNAPGSAADAELKKIMAEDDTVRALVEKWMAEAQNAEGPTAPAVSAALQLKAEERLAAVRKQYEGFLTRHPNHVGVHLAFGSFLYDQGLEQSSIKMWEKAIELDPKNPAAWSDLAHHYGHRGPVRKAFDYYSKAIELDPREPMYHHSLGTLIFLFRKDAAEHLKLDEQQVFDKALALYARAQELDPKDFTLAADIAQTYYGIRPPRHGAAIAAWERVLKLAPNDIERQGVHLHLARTKVNMGRFGDARADLAKVTHPSHQAVKERVARTLADREAKATAPPETPASKPSPPK